MTDLENARQARHNLERERDELRDALRGVLQRGMDIVKATRSFEEFRALREVYQHAQDVLARADKPAARP